MASTNVVAPAKAGAHAAIHTVSCRQEMRPCLYILASGRVGTLYVGVTSDLVRRVWQHKSGVVEGFTKQYGVHDLVFVEFHDTMEHAILR
jgi:putative endonuclease